MEKTSAPLLAGVLLEEGHILLRNHQSQQPFPFSSGLPGRSLYAVCDIGSNGTVDLLNLSSRRIVPVRAKHMTLDRFVRAGKLDEPFGLHELHWRRDEGIRIEPDTGSPLELASGMVLRRTGVPLPAALDGNFPYDTDLTVFMQGDLSNHTFYAFRFEDAGEYAAQARLTDSIAHSGYFLPVY